tara:strand:+ start:303 stop:635 length:333 start_codon:yes stop_codon:yes gene_type:complete
MLEVLIGVGLGILGVANAALWFKLSECHAALTTLISRTHDLKLEVPSLDDVKDEINDTLQDFMSNLHVPNAGDHLMGAASMAIQMWAQKKFAPQFENIQNQLENVEQFAQ